MNECITKINNLMKRESFWEWCAAVLFVLGIIVFPIHLRYSLLKDVMHQYGYINFFVLGATVILLLLKKQLSVLEKWMIFFWGIALISFFASNASITTGKSMAAFFNCLFPIALIVCRFREERASKIIKVILVCFNVFIVILLLNAIIEKVSGNAILSILVDVLKAQELRMYLEYPAPWRFFSLWGHALTNALLFNMFFILNDCYYRCVGKKYPKLIYFLIALVGVLLCASKTAIVVLVLYFIASSYRNKWIMIGSATGAVVLFLAGGFDLLIERFQTTALTSGRMERLLAYLNSTVYPLGMKMGYGTGSVFSIDEMEFFKAGFEFPILMHAFDYGVLFAIICIGSIYVYVTYHMWKKKQYCIWIGYSLLYAEINVYNGICLRNQDIFVITCVFTMLILTCCEILKNEQPDKESFSIEEDSEQEEPMDITTEEEQQ